MAALADYREIQAVLDAFDRNDTALFAVYQGKDLKFDSIELAEDPETARQYLNDNLEAIRRYGNTQTFKIVFYRRLSEKGTLTPENVKGSNTFKVVEPQDAGMLSYWQLKNGERMPPQPTQELSEIKEMLLAQQSQINALLQEPDEENNNSVNGSAGFNIMGLVNQLISHPEIQQAIAGRITGLINTIIPDPSGKLMPMQQTTQLAGTSEDQQVQIINDCLQRLFTAGLTLDDLQKLADMTKDQANFNFLLSLLRK